MPGEFYNAKQISKAEVGNGTTDALTLNIDRSGESGSKDFLIIMSGQMGSNDVSSADPYVELQVNGSNETDGDPVRVNPSNRDDTGLNFMQMVKVTLTAASHNAKIRLTGNSGSSGDECWIKGAYLTAVEIPSVATYAEENGEERFGSSWASKFSTTFNASNEDVLVIATADIAYEDESDSEHGIRLVVNSNEVMRHEPEAFMTSSNDDRFHSIGMVALVESLNGSNIVADIQGYGGGSSDEIRIKNSRIFILPLGEATYHKATTTNQSTSSGTYTDLLTDTNTLNDDNHLVVFGMQIGSPNTSQDWSVQAKDGTDTSERNSSNWEDGYNGSDSGSNPVSLGGHIGGAYNGSTTHELEWKNAATTNADRVSMTIIEWGSMFGATSNSERDAVITGKGESQENRETRMYGVPAGYSGKVSENFLTTTNRDAGNTTASWSGDGKVDYP